MRENIIEYLRNHPEGERDYEIAVALKEDDIEVIRCLNNWNNSDVFFRDSGYKWYIKDCIKEKIVKKPHNTFWDFIDFVHWANKTPVNMNANIGYLPKIFNAGISIMNNFSTHSSQKRIVYSAF